jgi:hypothetical protein
LPQNRLGVQYFGLFLLARFETFYSRITPHNFVSCSVVNYSSYKKDGTIFIDMSHTE